MIVEIKEVYDGRLPEYQVVEINEDVTYTVLETFDTYEEAQNYINKLNER